MPTSRKRVATVVVVLLAFAALNYSQLVWLERRLPSSFRAAHDYQTSQLIEIALRVDANSRSRYDMFVAIGLLAPDSTVVFPSGNAGDQKVPHVRFLSFGRVAGFAVWDGDGAAAVAGADARGVVVASGEGDFRGAPWIIVLDPDEGSVATEDDAAEAVYDALDGTVDPLRPDGGEFLFASIPGAPEGSEWTFTNVLIESSLVDEMTAVEPE